MNQLSYNEMKERSRKGEPIEALGLTFYPIKMDYYEQWCAYKSVLELRLSALPALYASMPFISAVFALEMDSISQNKTVNNYFSVMMHLLLMSMNIRVPDIKRVIKVYVQAENNNRLSSLTVSYGEVFVSISPQQFDEIRRIIAVQNGAHLPNEADNIDIVMAERDIAEIKNAPVDVSIDDLIVSVAVAQHVKVKDVYEWTVLDFENTRCAIDRQMRFIICGIAEGGGTKWSNGNPFPSWCFNKKSESAALIKADVWEKSLNGVIGTISDASQIPSIPNKQ